MVFSIVIILLIGLIAFFHYVQGFFSATLSAMITVLAAVLAVSYDETFVNLLLKGKAADVADSMMLCAIFAIVYIVLRVLFDAVVPGNVRTPSTVDKIGGALMGVVAGIFATGIFALAVQMLPFGPGISFMLYSRYPLRGDTHVVLPSTGNGAQLDASTHDELIENTITGDADSRGKQTGLLIPVDDLLLDCIYHLSDGGSLAGDRSLASVHPDYLQELFAERLGQQEGARRSALSVAGSETIDVRAVFEATSLPARDGIIKALRQPDYKAPAGIKAAGDQRLLVVRIVVHGNATDDEDKIFRFSPGSIRLVSHSKDYYPVGMLENGNTVLLDKPDDFLFLNLNNGDTAFDAVFVVDSNVLEGGKTGDKISDGTFVVVKRLAMLDLSGKDVSTSLTSDKSVQVMRLDVMKSTVMKDLPPPAPTVAPDTAPSNSPASTPMTPQNSRSPAAVSHSTPAAASTPQPEAAKAAMSATASVSTSIGFTIGAKAENGDDPNGTVAGGTVSLKAGGIAVAQIDPTESLDKLQSGDTQLKDFAVPDGFKMVQVAYSNPADPFGWVSQNGAIQLVDSNSNNYRASGVIVRFAQGAVDKAMVRYDMNHTQFAVPAINATALQSTTFLFLIRTGTHLSSFQVGNDSVPINVDVP
jgi:uncharacterized membrane protein required for colicin V production